MSGMNACEDKIGDLLRRFYAEYGVPEEGPPLGLDVSQLLGDMPIPDADLDILQRVLNDDTTRRQFRDCRAVLDDLASRLTGEELLAELLGVPLPTEQGISSCRVVCSGLRLPAVWTRARMEFLYPLSMRALISLCR
jgi:hypothetical protein